MTVTDSQVRLPLPDTMPDIVFEPLSAFAPRASQQESVSLTSGWTTVASRLASFALFPALVLSLLALAWIAGAISAPLVVRIPLVLASIVGCPAAALSKRLGARDPISRGVIGITSAAAVDMLGAEALLYLHLWHPDLLLVAAAVLSIGLGVSPRRRAGAGRHRAPRHRRAG